MPFATPPMAGNRPPESAAALDDGCTRACRVDDGDGDRDSARDRERDGDGDGDGKDDGDGDGDDGAPEERAMRVVSRGRESVAA